MKFRFVVVLVSGMLTAPVLAQQSAAPPSGSPQDSAMEQRMRDLEDRVIALEGQIRILKAAAAQPTPPQPGPAEAAVQNQTAPIGAAPAQTQEAALAAATAQGPNLGGAGGSAAKALNPDISVIGDFIGALGGNSQQNAVSLQPIPAFQMHESEVGFQSIIDPYARGDFFLSFGEEGVNLEEGFITFTALPGSFVAKAGKMRSAFGKVNTLHNHVLPWIDRPVVSGNLVGGEDGINDAGFSVTRILPAPKGLFVEGTGQLFRGDSSDVVKSSQRSDVSVVGHLRDYGGISESTNLDQAIAYARCPNGL